MSSLTCSQEVDFLLKHFSRLKAEKINKQIDLENPKIDSNISIKEGEKCRCWMSKTFPLCDGAHTAHNKASTGDNLHSSSRYYLRTNIKTNVNIGLRICDCLIKEFKTRTCTRGAQYLIS